MCQNSAKNREFIEKVLKMARKIENSSGKAHLNVHQKYNYTGQF
jgi:hypothetical protein